VASMSPLSAVVMGLGMMPPRPGRDAVSPMARESVLPGTAYAERAVEEPVLGLGQESLSVHAVDDEFTILSAFDIVSVSTLPPRFSTLARFSDELVVGICFCVLLLSSSLSLSRLSLPLSLSPAPQPPQPHPAPPPLSMHRPRPCTGDPPARQRSAG
jgi:hypothetical protein